MGQPTNALFERLGYKQLWFNNWTSAPIKHYYIFSVQRDWMLHKVIVLYLLYGFVIPRTNLWTNRDSCLYGQLGMVGSGGNIIGSSADANALPAFYSSLRVKARYYRSFNPPQILTEDREFVDSQPISNRVSYLSDVFFSKTHILQYKD
jgi:hypothetical protein